MSSSMWASIGMRGLAGAHWSSKARMVSMSSEPMNEASSMPISLNEAGMPSRARRSSTALA